MLPFAGSQAPDSSETLADGLRRGLAARGLPAREVAAQGAWPALDRLSLDLTGIEVSRSQLPSPAGEGRGGEFTVERFELLAAPASLESAPVQVSVSAENAVFEFAFAPSGESMLLIKRAAHGELTVEVTREDVERLVFSLASAAASQHGVVIKGVKVSFTSRGLRAVSFTADVTAKMFIASATVTLSGDLDLDEHLNARLSNLRFHGDGMVANLAGGFIRPQLAMLEGRVFPLMSFALGEISLRDVQLQVGDSLRLSAQFGS